MLSLKLKPTYEDSAVRKCYTNTKYFIQDNWQRTWVMALWICLMLGLFAYKFLHCRRRKDVYHVIGRNRIKLPKPLNSPTGFNAFWYSHYLFVIVYASLIVHGIKLFFTKEWYEKTESTISSSVDCSLVPFIVIYGLIMYDHAITSYFDRFLIVQGSDLDSLLE
ncbi:hypothetical protein Ahy_A07g032189 isoform D [Arachis hypogaea]|uniref:Uncharacterized protein n=1 Tax=Arachis hypogaea TaxID=3818 RepID=A0A445C6B0_ARAHY|nr:hypothetical protein Ahy_A07g032189 isoform B [Arachis hypogaea]RYR46450.1 hypothetical protein Ahy_A07g032189 isoform D [Arachis hypogaea]